MHEGRVKVLLHPGDDYVFSNDPNAFVYVIAESMNTVEALDRTTSDERVAELNYKNGITCVLCFVGFVCFGLRLFEF